MFKGLVCILLLSLSLPISVVWSVIEPPSSNDGSANTNNERGAVLQKGRQYDERYLSQFSSIDDTIRFIVKYKNQSGRQNALKVASQVFHDFHLDGYVAVELDSESLALLQADENIEAVEDDSLWTEDGVLEKVIEVEDIENFFNNTESMHRHLAESVPYGIEMIQATKLSYGKSKAMVCIVDTGVASGHPDLNPKLLSGASRKAGSNGAWLSWNVDKRGHGTHITGTVSAVPNNKYGVRGVGNIPVYMTRGLSDDGTARESDIREAMDQCEAAGAKVISLSLSGGQMTSLMEKSIDRLYGKGIIIVAASGNDGKRLNNYPAAYSKVISVGAVEKDGTRWKGSNYGSTLELTAPGAGILSTGFTYKGDFTYVLYSGTSMATPHVAGAAALLFSHFPSCTPTQIRYAMASTAKDKGSAGCDEFFGYGIVQVKSAYNFLAKHSCKGASWGKKVGDGKCSAIDAKVSKPKSNFRKNNA